MYGRRRFPRIPETLIKGIDNSIYRYYTNPMIQKLTIQQRQQEKTLKKINSLKRPFKYDPFIRLMDIRKKLGTDMPRENETTKQWTEDADRVIALLEDCKKGVSW